MFNKKKFLHCISFIVLLLMLYFFYKEFRNNWNIFHKYYFNINLIYIIIAFFSIFFAYIIDTFILHICINKHIARRRIPFLTNIAIFNTSNILKYIPGRIWGYMAQVLFFSKKRISKSEVLYVNFICFIGNFFSSILLGILCVIYYFPILEYKIKLILLIFLILDLTFIFWNTTLINILIRFINFHFNMEIQILHTSKFLLIGIQLVYLIHWYFVGLGGYLLAQGIGLEISFTNFYAILASMSLSWVIGYLSVITPGGLGVREGVMYVILNQVTNVQTALLMPIATRLLYLLVELALGFIGFLLAVKFRIFSAISDINPTESDAAGASTCWGRPAPASETKLRRSH